MTAAPGTDGVVYIIGDDADQGETGATYVYHPDANTWNQVASVPIYSGPYGLQGTDAATTAPDGTIYAFSGGWANSQVSAYNQNTNTWTQVDSHLYGAYGKAATAGLDGTIYVMGGYTTNYAAVSEVDAYTPIPLNLTVTTLADDPIAPISGSTTLRDAITQANASTDSQEVINFAPGLQGTIDLTSALPALKNNATIQGPGSSNLTIQRDSTAVGFSVFTVNSGETVNISGMTITGGDSGVNGGGICNLGTLTVDNSVLTNNSAYSYGGGIYNNGTLTVTGSTFADNSAAGDGGGICNDWGGALTVTNSTFVNNYVTFAGGGICTFGTAMVINSTLTGNDAGGGATGSGGIYCYGTLTVTNSTIANNIGDGICNGVSYSFAILTLNNTIVAGNSGLDIYGPLQPTSSNNLIGNGTGITNLAQLATSNLIGTAANPINPILGPLVYNGGATQTMALLPGSPAINAGSNALIPAGVTTDQRGAGFLRVVNGTVDIGAFESSGFTVTVTSGSGQSTGPLTAFSAPLVATVTANNPSEPVAGGLVTFTAPPNGASATLSGSPATITATGTASVTAAANSIVGSYTVSATASGITTPASFSLTNMWVPTFSALISPAIVYGTSTTTLTGHLGSGTAYPTGSNVSITLNSVTQTASVDGSGDFTTTFSTGSLGVAGGPYTVTYAFAGNSSFTAATDTSTTLTVTAAPLTASIIGDPTKTYDGTTSATLTQANFSLSGLVGTQSFTVTPTVGTYNSKDVTAATTVMASLSPSDFTPGSGTVASNYILPTTASGAGTITPKALTYSGLSVPASKVYDGTTTVVVSGTAALQAAEAAGTGSTEDGKTYSVDSVSLTGTPTGTYNSKDVATATTVTFGGLALTGTGNGDYTLTASTQAATITPRTVTASIIGDPSKTYNGSTSATLSPSNFSLTGVISGESFTVTQTAGTYNSKDVSTATTVTANLSAGNFTPGSGTLASDYTLPTTASGAGNINAAPLTVTATDQPMTYGSTVPALTYTYTGLVNNDTSATFSGSLVTTATSSSSVGDYPITVGTLVATGNYTVGTFNVGTLTVKAAPLTITANNATKVYGAPLPLLGVSYSGFVNGDTAANLTTPATLATTATASSHVLTGGYGIIASGASDPNYAITYQPGTLTIAAAPLTVTANNASKVYGTGMPTLTANYDGFVNGDTAANLTTPPVLTTTATASSNVLSGGYDIAVSGASDSDYTISYVDGTLSVTPAPLTVNATNESMVYGGTVPTLTYTYTGLVNSDSSATFSGGLVTTATSLSSVGDYAITQGTLAATGNYTIGTYNPGTLTVNAAPLTITANNDSKTYGTLKTFSSTTFTETGLVNGDTITGVTETSTGAPASEPVGTYPIILSAATDTGLSNYTITYLNGTLTVNPALLIVNATNKSMTYDGTVPALTYTYTGLVNSDSSATFSGSLGIANYIPTVGFPLDVGDYTINNNNWGPLSATGNYTIGTFNPGILSITPAAAPAITIVPYNVTYDGLTHNATGIAAGVSIFGNTETQGLVINSTHTGSGTYVDNWIFSNPDYNFASGTFVDTISKANPIVVVTPYSVVYNGAANTATGAAYGINNVALTGLNLNNTVHTNASTYTDTWTFSNPNYNSASSAVVDTIAKASANIVVTGYNTFYNAEPHMATGTAYGINGVVLPGLNLNGTTHIDVGTYTDVWTFTDATGNYNNASGTVVDTITPSKSKMVRETVLVPKTTVVKATVLVPGIKEVKVVERVQVNGKWIKKTVLVPETVLVKKTVLVNETKMTKKTEMVKVYYS